MHWFAAKGATVTYKPGQIARRKRTQVLVSLIKDVTHLHYPLYNHSLNMMLLAFVLRFTHSVYLR